MKLYVFRQSNPGGKLDRGHGVDVRVVIEAENANTANKRAQDIGIYFDGVDEGRDCSCCGDRWNPINESDGAAAWDFSEKHQYLFTSTKAYYPFIGTKDGENDTYVYWFDGTSEHVNFKAFCEIMDAGYVARLAAAELDRREKEERKAVKKRKK